MKRLAILAILATANVASAQRAATGRNGGFPPYHAPTAPAPTIKVQAPAPILPPVVTVKIVKGAAEIKAPAVKSASKAPAVKVQSSTLTTVPGPNGAPVDLPAPQFVPYTLKIGTTVIETALVDNGSFRYRAGQTARMYNRTVTIWQGRTKIATVNP